MRRILVWGVITIFSISPSITEARALTDTERNLYWCVGFYSEIKNQAINDNNPLLFNKSAQNIGSYALELIVYSNSSTDVTDAAEEEAAKKSGALAAGLGFWRTGNQADRDFISRSRYPKEQTCDAVAEQAELFRAQAMAIAEKWRKASSNTSKGNSSKDR